MLLIATNQKGVHAIRCSDSHTRIPTLSYEGRDLCNEERKERILAMKHGRGCDRRLQ